MKVLRHYIQQVIDQDRLDESSNDVFPELQQRFGLRGISSQITDLFLELLASNIDVSDFKSASFYSFSDGDEAFFQINGSTVEIEPPIFVGDYADSMGDVSIDIAVNLAKSFDIDADYVHDGKDIDDMGSIEVRILLPPITSDDLDNLLLKMRKDLRGTLAHEMQHSIQKIIYGTPLDSTSFSDIHVHMNDPQEIDARVEETIAFLEDNVDESDLELFMVELEAYIHRYLGRNVKAGKDDPEYDVYFERMMDSHLKVYRGKLGI